MRSPPPASELIERHAPWLLGWFVVRGVPRDGAEDLVQETLLRLLRNLDGLRSEHAVPAWLRQTARDLLTRHRRRRWPAPLQHEPRAPESLPDERATALHAALRELPEELEQVVLVRFSRGLSYEQTAAVLGVSRATVQSRLRRALASLRARLRSPEPEMT